MTRRSKLQLQYGRNRKVVANNENIEQRTRAMNMGVPTGRGNLYRINRHHLSRPTIPILPVGWAERYRDTILPE